MASSPIDNQDSLSFSLVKSRLVEWFRSDQNYARWKTAQLEAAAEINAALREQGVCQVEDSCIAEMMVEMERAFLDANELLVNKGILDPNDFQRCDKSLLHRIQQLCSDFPLLAPVMSLQSITKERGDELPNAKRYRPNSTMSSVALPASGACNTDMDWSDPASTVMQECDWESDCSNGKYPIEVLLEWLLTESNYACFQSCDLLTRGDILVTINTMMQAEGIDHLTPESISQQIAQLQQSLVQAEEFIQQSGVCRPLVVADFDEDLKRKVLECCPYYELLALVMTTLPSSKNNTSDQPESNQSSQDDAKDNQESPADAAANMPSVAATSVAAVIQSPEPSVVKSREPLAIVNVIDKSIPANQVWNIVFVNGKSASDVLLEWLTVKENYFQLRRKEKP